MKRLFSLLILAVALVAPQAYAGLIATDEGLQERERVKAMLERPEVAKQLEQMGVPAADAQARVDAMNDAEVRELAGRIDALAAGGQLTNDQLIVILLIVLILVLLL